MTKNILSDSSLGQYSMLTLRLGLPEQKRTFANQTGNGVRPVARCRVRIWAKTLASFFVSVTRTWWPPCPAHTCLPARGAGISDPHFHPDDQHGGAGGPVVRECLLCVSVILRIRVQVVARDIT